MMWIGYVVNQASSLSGVPSSESSVCQKAVHDTWFCSAIGAASGLVVLLRSIESLALTPVGRCCVLKITQIILHILTVLRCR